MILFIPHCFLACKLNRYFNNFCFEHMTLNVLICDTQKCFRKWQKLLVRQADMEKIESRTQFSDMVLCFFYRNAKVNVLRWVCSREEHKDQWHHNHMAIKLDRRKRWLSVRKHLDQKFGIKVHFSEKHSNYYETTYFHM